MALRHIQNPVDYVYFGPVSIINLNEIYAYNGVFYQPDWYVEDHHDEEEDVENG